MSSTTVINLNMPASENSEMEPSRAFVLNNLLSYVVRAITSKTILKKPTGTVKFFAFDGDTEMAGKYSPFDNLVQILEGSAEIIIGDTSNLLNAGQIMIIPAHSKNAFKARGRFKMLSTSIKSGYEDV